MYLYETIDKLVLLTLEGYVTEPEFDEIREKLQSGRDNGQELVVSIDLSYLDREDSTREVEKGINDLLRFCHDSDIRVHFYRFQ